MTIGFGLPSTLLLLGFVVLVFLLLAVAVKDAGYTLNLSNSSVKGKQNKKPIILAEGSEGLGFYKNGILVEKADT